MGILSVPLFSYIGMSVKLFFSLDELLSTLDAFIG